MCRCGRKEHLLDCPAYAGPWYVNVYELRRTYWCDQGVPLESVLCETYSEATSILHHKRLWASDKGNVMVNLSKIFARPFPERVINLD